MQQTEGVLPGLITALPRCDYSETLKPATTSLECPGGEAFYASTEVTEISSKGICASYMAGSNWMNFLKLLVMSIS